MTYHAYKVGELYSPSRTSWPEAGEYNYRAGAHELRLFFANLTPSDISDITRRPAEFAVVVDGPVLFFLYRFGKDEWSDAPYSWHLVQAARPDEATTPAPLEENERALLHVILVEATTGVIAGMRMVSLSIALSRYLHSAIEAQIAVPFNQAAYDRHILEVYRRETSAQLAMRGERMRVV